MSAPQPAHPNRDQAGEEQKTPATVSDGHRAPQATNPMPPPKSKPRSRSAKTVAADGEARQESSGPTPADLQEIAEGEAQLREDDLLRRIDLIIRDFEQNGMAAFTRDLDSIRCFSGVIH